MGLFAFLSLKTQCIGGKYGDPYFTSNFMWNQKFSGGTFWAYKFSFFHQICHPKQASGCKFQQIFTTPLNTFMLLNHQLYFVQQTYLWVLNEDSEFDFAFNKLKVAGVMTDYPTRLRDYLHSSNLNPGQPVPTANGSERSELIKKD